MSLLGTYKSGGSNFIVMSFFASHLSEERFKLYFLPKAKN